MKSSTEINSNFDFYSMNIIGTGLSGLVGSRVVELLPFYNFEDLSRETGVDILDKAIVIDRFKNSNSQIALHMAAITDVDGSETEKDKKEESLVWKVNVCGTKNVIDACAVSGKHLIYISTDMVFPGTKAFGEKYAEDEKPAPVGWYATTKYEAEKLVENSTIPWTIVRIAYPFRANFQRKEYVRIFLSLLKAGKKISAVTDHYFTPIFIDDIPIALEILIKNKAAGKFHLVGDQVVSPYEVAKTIADNFDLDRSLISKTTRKEYFKDRAPRAFNLSLNNDKIKKLGIKPLSFKEGLLEIKRQISNL